MKFTKKIIVAILFVVAITSNYVRAQSEEITNSYAVFALNFNENGTTTMFIFSVDVVEVDKGGRTPVIVRIPRSCPDVYGYRTQVLGGSSFDASNAVFNCSSSLVNKGARFGFNYALGRYIPNPDPGQAPTSGFREVTVANGGGTM